MKFYQKTYKNQETDVEHLVTIHQDCRYDFKQYNAVIKQTGKTEGEFFELYFSEWVVQEIGKELIPLSAKDSVVFREANRMLDSLGWNKVERTHGAPGFIKKKIDYEEH